MNSLHIDTEDHTPESKLYGVNIENIPVKPFHTMFCPCYILNSRLHNAGSIGPPKWEPRSNICVYLGHSPFHAGSVALVYNPSTGHVSPQYHVVFDDDFTTHKEKCLAFSLALSCGSKFLLASLNGLAQSRKAKSC